MDNLDGLYTLQGVCGLLSVPPLFLFGILPCSIDMNLSAIPGLGASTFVGRIGTLTRTSGLPDPFLQS